MIKIPKKINLYKPLVRQISDSIGGIPILSQKLQVTRQAVYQWYHYGIPAKHAIAIEKLTKGKFKASHLIGFQKQM